MVPDSLAKGAKVIFNDGGSQQYPGSRQPGLDYNGGIVKWDGSSAALAAVECTIPVPVTSVSISGDGVSGGKLSLKAGASAQLTATVKPDDATDRKVTWTSSDSSVANVMGTGVVTAGSKAGTATIKATAGGKSASVTVTVTDVPKQPMTVWYHPDASWTTVKANWRLESDPKTLGRNVDMDKVKDGWYRLTIPDTKGSRVAVTFTDMKRLDNNANRNYVASGSVMAVKDGVLTLKAPDLESKQPMTVWYHPDASWTTVKANWRLESDPKTLGRNVDMDKVKDGWYRLTIPDTKGSRVAVTFTDMKRLDNNANRNYVVSGGSMAVSGGQVIGDVTPNCAVTKTRVVPEKLRTLDRGRPWRDSQFASTRLSPSRDMSR